MGWWGVGVVDGDGPWDAIDEIEDEAGITEVVNEFDEDDNSKLIAVPAHPMFAKCRDMFKAMPLDKMLEIALECQCDDEEHIAIQTVAFLYLKWQVTMPEEFKKKALEACDVDDSDEFGGSEERRTSVAALKAAIEKQDGHDLPFTGLFWAAELPKRELFD